MESAGFYSAQTTPLDKEWSGQMIPPQAGGVEQEPTIPNSRNESSDQSSVTPRAGAIDK
jgi:hypothetical protein